MTILIRKTTLFFIIIVCSLFITACPGSLVKNLEQREKNREELVKKHKADYLGNALSYKEYLNTVSIDDSLNKSNRIATDTNHTIVLSADNNISLEIININKSYLPDSLIVDLYVKDGKGRQITGLAPPYYKNYRDFWISLTDSLKSSQYEIEEFSVREYQKDISPDYAISFVLDHSGSIGENVSRKLQKGVLDLVQYLKKQDMVSINKFTDEYFNEIPLREDKFFILDSFEVNGLKGVTGSGTYYYDAIVKAAKELSSAPDSYSKIIIAFTDGGDGGSEADEKEVIRLLKQYNIKLYNIGYLYADPDVLNPVSLRSGGKYYFTISTREFPYVLKDIYQKLSNFYRISFKPKDLEGLHTAIPSLKLSELDNKIYKARAEFYINKLNNKRKGDVVFYNIEFETGESETSEKESTRTLNSIAEWMLVNSKRKILVIGHTDNVGDKVDNLELSYERAKFVKEYLVERGVIENRIKIKGEGEENPLFPNDSPENRRKNRRTEVEILE